MPDAPLTDPAAPAPLPTDGLPGDAVQAVFLDLDNTIIAGSSALAFARPFARNGLVDRATVVRGAWAQLMLVLSGADASTMDTLRRRMTLLCQGWEVDRVREIVDGSVQEVVAPLVYPEAVRLIERHREQGAQLVLLSASGLEVVAPIAAMIGIDRFRATTMRIVDGRYGGEIESYCYGEGKAVAAREIAAQSGLDLARCAAYTDSITDLPLLEAVGSPAVVNPDRELRRIARERGWPVLAFVRARSRRDRLFRLADRLADRFAPASGHPALPARRAGDPAGSTTAGEHPGDAASVADHPGEIAVGRPTRTPPATTVLAASALAATAAGGVVLLALRRPRRP